MNDFCIMQRLIDDIVDKHYTLRLWKRAKEKEWKNSWKMMHCCDPKRKFLPASKGLFGYKIVLLRNDLKRQLGTLSSQMWLPAKNTWVWPEQNWRSFESCPESGNSQWSSTCISYIYRKILAVKAHNRISEFFDGYCCCCLFEFVYLKHAPAPLRRRCIYMLCV